MFCSENYINDSGKSNIAYQAGRDTEKYIRLVKKDARLGQQLTEWKLWNQLGELVP